MINFFSKNNFNKTKLVNLFLLAMFMLGISSGIFRSIFNNYLEEIHSFTTADRGFIEFPRELFGFLIVLVIGVFHFINESKLIAIGTFIASLSYLGLAYFSPNKSLLIFWILIWSLGSHILVNLRYTLGLILAKSSNKGQFFGKMASFSSIGFVVGTIIVWSSFQFGSFKFCFFIAFLATILSCFVFNSLPIKQHYKLVKRKALIFKMKYIHYYSLALLFGIRKQLFLVFAPWFIIKVLEETTSTIAIILLVASVLGIFLKPLLGKLIDLLGERKILIYDGLILSIVALGYIVAPYFLSGLFLLLIISSLLIIDELSFALKNAREIYLSKIVESKEDITPSIAAGISLEHMISMTMPFLAGIIWLNYGYQWIFGFCSILALFTAFYTYRFIIYK